MSVTAQQLRLIDCDVHQALDSRFKNYLEEPWRSMALPGGISWPASVLGHTGYREDIGAKGGSGLAKDSEPDFVVKELLEGYGVDIAILTGSRILSVNNHPNSQFALAWIRAYNDWLIETWLSHDPRFKGTMMVIQQDIAGSVREIERVGNHPNIVQVMTAGSSPILFGKRYFWPLYEAAEHYNLPVALHPLGLTPPSGSGFGSTYLENHTTLATGYMDHLVSLLCEGVFEQFPRLKFVFIEGGVAVFAPLMWRLDKNWKAVRAEVPWLTRKPSEYLVSNVRFTSQPVEEPERQELLIRLLETLDAERTLMFATDWPHWDFDSPTAVFNRFPEKLKQRIFVENARELYGFGDRP